MTRRRGLDWALIVALTGVLAVLGARMLGEGLRTQRGFFQPRVLGGRAGEYPTLHGSAPPEFETGDQLLALDGQDLRGTTALHVYDRFTRLARANGTVSVRASRAGVPFEVRVGLTPRALWWFGIPWALLYLVVGAAVLLRAPEWPLARLNFVFLCCWPAAHFFMDWIEGPRAPASELVPCVAMLALASGLGVWMAQGFTRSSRPVPGWQRVLPVVAAAAFPVNLLGRSLLPLSFAQSVAIASIAGFVIVGLTLAAFTRAYRRSDALERRQIRWVVLGYYFGYLGVWLGSYLTYVPAGTAARVVGAVTSMGVPAGILVSVIGFRWLDIDRLISATASYTIVGIAVVGTALAVLPRAAGAVAPGLGVDPPVAQWLLTMTLLLAAVPVLLQLRPRLDRQMFRDRHRRTSGLEQLADEIAGCADADELWALTSERIGALLEPQSLVLYARDGGAFVERFTHGRPPAPPYDADSLLVRALERRGRPLAADSAELDPFDRAALETLGVALVVPVRAHDQVLAFACLGPKRSGDIYTPEEMVRLGAVAERCAEVLRPVPPEPAEGGHVFRREGELWTIASHGKEFRLRDMRGLRYLATLLREPGREFAVTDLVGAESALAPAAFRPGPELSVAHRLGDAGPVLDARARSAYRERIGALDTELADAERCADLGRLERASAEREALFAELESAGRGRRAGSDSERARVAVTKAIKVALEKIAERHPELGEHLAATVRRGYVCSYEPDPRRPVEWEV